MYLKCVSPLQYSLKTATSPTPSSSWFLTCTFFLISFKLHTLLLKRTWVVQKLYFLCLRMRRGELFDYLTEKVTLSEKETRSVRIVSYFIYQN